MATVLNHERVTVPNALPSNFLLGRPSLDIEDELLAVATISDVAALGVSDIGMDDVREWFASPGTDPGKDSWIVRDISGRLVAWAHIDNWSGKREEVAFLYIEPDAAGEVRGPLTELLVRRSAERAAEAGHPDHQLRFRASRTQTDFETELAARGCTPQTTVAQLRRVLDGSEGQVPAPDGVTVRHGIVPGDEMRMREFHSVIARGFGANDDTPYDVWRSHLAAVRTTPYDEWVIAEADSQLVGVVQTIDTSDDDMGYVRKIAVLPNYRRRGIARLLLDQSFSTFHRKGFAIAGLDLNVANESAYRLYESLGMTVAFELRSWPLTVPAARPNALLDHIGTIGTIGTIVDPIFWG